jgi:hypothetical protein
MLHINDQENWLLDVFSEHLIDLNIMSLKGRSSNIPTDKTLFLCDFSHHIEHAFVVKMIKEPNVVLRDILFEWDGI